MKFYRIDTSGMFMNRKYAYLSVNKKNQIKYTGRKTFFNFNLQQNLPKKN